MHATPLREPGSHRPTLARTERAELASCLQGINTACGLKRRTHLNNDATSHLRRATSEEADARGLSLPLSIDMLQIGQGGAVVLFDRD